MEICNLYYMPLGRGLGSLIPPKVQQISEVAHINQAPQVASNYSTSDNRERIWRVPIGEIQANTVQPRHHFAEGPLADLASSIGEHGILQPLVAIKTTSGYELIAGERRLRAAKLAGLKEVPVIVREVSSQQKLELALIENLQRENLNPIEMARSVQQLAEEFNLSQEAVAKRLGKSRSAIANSLRLLALPEEIQDALADGRISEGHGKILAGLDTPVKQQVMFKKIMANNLSVAETAEVTRRSGGSKQAQIKAHDEDRVVEDELSGLLGAKTIIRRTKKGGQIMINFFSDDELNQVVKRIGI